MSARRLLPLCPAGLACGLLAIAPGPLAPPLLVYNTTASVPLGLYRVDEREVRNGDLALVRPPKALARWLAIGAGLAGVIVPVMLDRMDQDPAVASSVFVTMITDSMGFFAFLGLAVASGLVG